MPEPLKNSSSVKSGIEKCQLAALNWNIEKLTPSSNDHCESGTLWDIIIN